MVITTLEQFIERVRALEQIHSAYELFEDETADAVRGEIYRLADPASPEPFRSAMINLGFEDY